MGEGCGEGMVVVSPSSGKNCAITKWKIGAEKNQTNTDYIDAMLQEIEANGEKMFGGNAVKAKEMFALMRSIALSTKKVEPVRAVSGGKKGGTGSSGGYASDIQAKYEEAIKSARSKFDYYDVYFAKDNKPTDYAKLIAE